MSHHVIDRAQSLGNKLANAIALADSLISEIGEIHAAMSAARGSPADDTKLEGSSNGFGIAATEGADVFSFVNSLKTDADTFASSSATWRSSLRQE